MRSFLTTAALALAACCLFAPATAQANSYYTPARAFYSPGINYSYYRPAYPTNYYYPPSYVGPRFYIPQYFSPSASYYYTPSYSSPSYLYTPSYYYYYTPARIRR